jgi:molecular chaperone GrpE (heat shock protein)
MLNLIINQHDIFKNDTQAQTAEIKAMQTETNETIIELHGATRIEIIEAIQIAEHSNEAAQQATQQEITQLKEAIQQLSDQMKQKDAELKVFLKDFRETRSQKKKKKLQELSNAVSATLLALEVMYRTLQVCLMSVCTCHKAH